MQVRIGDKYAPNSSCIPPRFNYYGLTQATLLVLVGNGLECVTGDIYVWNIFG